MIGTHWTYLLFLPGMIVVIAVIVGVILLAIRTVGVPAPPYPPAPMQAGAARETPLEILARRFASGEISAEEYQKAKDLLSS